MIDLTDYPNDIALLFSGGIDSTLLFYLISTKISKQHLDKKLTLYILDRYNKPIDKAKVVFDRVIDKTHLPVELKLLNIPQVVQHHEIMIASKLIGKHHPVVVCGVNRYPSDDSIRPNHLANIKESGKLKFPLAHIEKDIIIQEFFNLGIEDLLPFTHSCGSNYSQPCSKCFNCRERIWAYDAIGKPVNLGQ